MIKMVEKQDWKTLTKFAKEQGFKVRDNNILLPLDNIANYEYGIVLKPPELIEYRTAGIETSKEPAVYVRNCKTEKIKYGDESRCYTPEMIIRTVEVGDKRFVIEREQKEEIDQKKGLIWAFKFKDLGTIDATYLRNIYPNILEILPKRTAKRLLKNKISELEEKLEEVEALKLPEYDKIIENIMNEFITYREASKKAKIKFKNIKFPNLAEKTCLHYIMNKESKDFGTHYNIRYFVKWCEKTGNPIKLQNLDDEVQNKVQEIYAYMLTLFHYKEMDALQEVTGIEPALDPEYVAKLAPNIVSADYPRHAEMVIEGYKEHQAKKKEK